MVVISSGPIVQETYRVEHISQVKCWTILELEGSPCLPLRRKNTRQDCLDSVVGEEIGVRRIEHPSLPNSLILDVTYHGQKIYPVHPF